MYNTIKYTDSLITFTEIPDEISLCFNISGCPHHCDQCFEPWLREDRGQPLTYEVIKQKYQTNPHITCICFMGGDRYHKEIVTLIQKLKQDYSCLKFALYSGDSERDTLLEPELDYYKIGSYMPQEGPLNQKTTNQRFYKKDNGQ